MVSVRDAEIGVKVGVLAPVEMTVRRAEIARVFEVASLEPSTCVIQ
jgi:hypothetical protein